MLALARILLTPVVIALILAAPDNDTARIAAVVVFVIAALTDYADGYLARRWQITTTLGAFLDLLADKVLVTGALIALVANGWVSTWAAFLIIARELAVMALRGVAALDESSVPASIWGKWKAAIQFTAIAVAILHPDVVIGPWRLDEWLMALAVVVTLISAGDYFSRFRAVLSPQRDQS